MGAVSTLTVAIFQAIGLVTVKEVSLNLPGLPDLDIVDASTLMVAAPITEDAIPQPDALIMEVVERADVRLGKGEEDLALIHAIHTTKQIVKLNTVNMNTVGLNQVHTRLLKKAEAIGTTSPPTLNQSLSHQLPTTAPAPTTQCVDF